MGVRQTLFAVYARQIHTASGFFEPLFYLGDAFFLHMAWFDAFVAGAHIGVIFAHAASIQLPWFFYAGDTCAEWRR